MRGTGRGRARPQPSGCIPTRGFGPPPLPARPLPRPCGPCAPRPPRVSHALPEPPRAPPAPQPCSWLWGLSSRLQLPSRTLVTTAPLSRGHGRSGPERRQGAAAPSGGPEAVAVGGDRRTAHAASGAESALGYITRPGAAGGSWKVPPALAVLVFRCLGSGEQGPRPSDCPSVRATARPGPGSRRSGQRRDAAHRGVGRRTWRARWARPDAHEGVRRPG